MIFIAVAVIVCGRHSRFPVYDRIAEYNMDWKAEFGQLSLWHNLGTSNEKHKKYINRNYKEKKN